MFSITKKLILYGLATYGAITLYHGCTKNSISSKYHIDDNIGGICTTIPQNLESKIIVGVIADPNHKYFKKTDNYALYNK